RGREPQLAAGLCDLSRAGGDRDPARAAPAMADLVAPAADRDPGGADRHQAGRRRDARRRTAGRADPGPDAALGRGARALRSADRPLRGGEAARAGRLPALGMQALRARAGSQPLLVVFLLLPVVYLVALVGFPVIYNLLMSMQEVN